MTEWKEYIYIYIYKGKTSKKQNKEGHFRSFTPEIIDSVPRWNLWWFLGLSPNPPAARWVENFWRGPWIQSPSRSPSRRVGRLVWPFCLDSLGTAVPNRISSWKFSSRRTWVRIRWCLISEIYLNSSNRETLLKGLICSEILLCWTFFQILNQLFVGILSSFVMISNQKNYFWYIVIKAKIKTSLISIWMIESFIGFPTLHSNEQTTHPISIQPQIISELR